MGTRSGKQDCDGSFGVFLLDGAGTKIGLSKTGPGSQISDEYDDGYHAVECEYVYEFSVTTVAEVLTVTLPNPKDTLGSADVAREELLDGKGPAIRYSFVG